MKIATVAIWCIGFLPLSLVGASAELAAAYRNGAMSRVVYRVIDNHGGIVSNAIAHVWYRSYGRPQDNENWLTKTDTNGCFVAEHRTNEKLSVLIGKEGYYNTRDEVSYFDTERNVVAADQTKVLGKHPVELGLRPPCPAGAPRASWS